MLLDKLNERIESLRLNLNGFTVLTEAASGPYVVTPLIAALAGAKVYAFSKNSVYGSAKDVFTETEEIITNWKRQDLKIKFVEQLNPEIIAEADIITNSGHLRPLNAVMLQYAKKGAVISLMYEAWEWRESDIDLTFARKNNIRIGAINERHPEIDVFNYLGDMAIKQIFDAGITLFDNTFILICNNSFGPYIAKVLARNCRKLGIVDLPENKMRYDHSAIEWIGDFYNFVIPEHFRNTEAIIFTAYPFDKSWIGENAPISPKLFSSAINNPYILRFAGDLDEQCLTDYGIKFYPEIVKSGHMGILPSAIGYDPIIRLQSGGLKVGEALLSGEFILNDDKVGEEF